MQLFAGAIRDTDPYAGRPTLTIVVPHRPSLGGVFSSSAEVGQHWPNSSCAGQLWSKFTGRLVAHYSRLHTVLSSTSERLSRRPVRRTAAVEDLVADFEARLGSSFRTPRFARRRGVRRVLARATVCSRSDPAPLARHVGAPRPPLRGRCGDAGPPLGRRSGAAFRRCLLWHCSRAAFGRCSDVARVTVGGGSVRRLCGAQAAAAVAPWARSRRWSRRRALGPLGPWARARGRRGDGRLAAPCRLAALSSASRHPSHRLLAPRRCISHPRLASSRLLVYLLASSGLASSPPSRLASRLAFETSPPRRLLTSWSPSRLSPRPLVIGCCLCVCVCAHVYLDIHVYAGPAFLIFPVRLVATYVPRGARVSGERRAKGARAAPEREPSVAREARQRHPSGARAAGPEVAPSGA